MPRVSINQLATYLVATPSQRRRILRDAKAPATFRVNWYDFARSSIEAFVGGGMADDSILTNESQRLLDLEPTNEFEETRHRTNAEAIDSFLDCFDQIQTNGMELTLGPNASNPTVVHDIEISVRPEFLISGDYRNSPTCGGVKLYFSKADPLTNVSAPYITAALMQHIQNHHQPDGHSTRHQNCQVVDVFGGQVHSAPRAITRRFADIEAACQEIGLIWPTV